MSYPQSIIEKFLEAIARDEKPRKPGLHVSDLSRDCLRASWYRLRLGDFQTPHTIMNFWRGRKLHETRILQHHELEVTCKLQNKEVHATIDEYENGLLLDKKTCTETPKEVPPETVRQLEYYTFVLRWNNFEVNQIQVLYLDILKNRTQLFTITPRDTEQIESEMLTRKQMLDGTEPPPRNMHDPYCPYCPYGVQCFKSKE